MKTTIRVVLAAIVLVALVAGAMASAPPVIHAQDDPEECIANGVPPMMLGGIQQRVGIEGEMPQPLVDMIAVMMCDLEVPADLQAEVDALVSDGVVTEEQVAQVEEMMGGGRPGGDEGEMPSESMGDEAQSGDEFPVSTLTPADIPEPDALLFPREIEFEGQAITIEALPERIVVLSTDMGDMLLQLVPPRYFAAIPARLEDGVMANFPMLAAAVETKLSNENQWDPEVILSYDPDLIVVHVRMQGETDALAVLADLGIPVIAFQSPLETPDQIAEAIRVLGEATGSDAQAETLIEDFMARVEAINEKLAGVEERPLVLVLSTPGGMPMVLGTNTISDGLLRVAGGRSASEEMGVRGMSMADAEQVMAVDPEKIILIDFVGAGRAPFAPILEAPGMETTRAMQDEDNILMLPTRYLMISSNSAIEGVERIAAWLYPDLFTEAE
ncbi:MAG: ABC transporter substrate-binding protein [Chloroflexi bacterium]|nr:ABC transporter substrate-binding protein [Chloroflexota bacterium]